jgi:hypothetical protein
MHHGSDNTPRLSKLLRLLQAHPDGLTTLQIQLWTGSMAPATDCSELRQSGHVIACRCQGVNPQGRRVYKYTYGGKTQTPPKQGKQEVNR